MKGRIRCAIYALLTWAALWGFLWLCYELDRPKLPAPELRIEQPNLTRV